MTANGANNIISSQENSFMRFPTQQVHQQQGEIANNARQYIGERMQEVQPPKAVDLNMKLPGQQIQQQNEIANTQHMTGRTGIQQLQPAPVRSFNVQIPGQQINQQQSSFVNAEYLNNERLLQEMKPVMTGDYVHLWFNFTY